MSACQRGVPTFIDGVRDLVKSTTIALLGDGLGAGEGGHCSEESRLRVVVVEMSGSEGGGCIEISVRDDGPFEVRWVHWRLGTRSGRDVEWQR